jgi:phospholipid N-methyltransferase
MRQVSALTQFWREFLASPGRTGAIAPSSPALGRRMVEWIDWPQARTVIECGPGNGAFTGEILRRLRPDAAFLAVELNPRFVEALRPQFPGAEIVEGSVQELPALAARAGLGPADAVLSSLPWAAFPPPLQRDCLGAIRAALAPGGQFVTFAYNVGRWTAKGRRFRDLLPHYFSQVEESPTAWLNLPPAFVYRCRR